MSRRKKHDWVSLGVDTWLLGLDAGAVIGMRMARLAAGDAAAAVEAQRMVTEKVEAAIGLQMLAMRGALGATPAGMVAKSLRHYGPKVRANRRRLGKR